VISARQKDDLPGLGANFDTLSTHQTGAAVWRADTDVPIPVTFPDFFGESQAQGDQGDHSLDAMGE
jgi:hypothetical protein